MNNFLNSSSRIYIGHVGEPLAGKETVGNFVAEWAKEKGFTSSRHRFRDVLEETLITMKKASDRGAFQHEILIKRILKNILSLWSIDTTDENLQKLARAIFNEEMFGARAIEINRSSLQKLAQVLTREEAFGANALANAIRQRLTKSPGNIIQADGVRWLSDEALIRGLRPNIMLYTTANFEVRLARAQKRNREGEGELTYEEFLRQNREENEKYIPEIGSRADWKIINNYMPSETLSEEESKNRLKEKVLEFCEIMIIPKLKVG